MSKVTAGFARASIILVLICIAPSIGRSQSINSQVLNEIKIFATEFCGEYLIKGDSHDIELAGGAKARLDGFLGRLADLGVSGTAVFNSQEYLGLLQEDVAAQLDSVRQCRLKLWEDFRAVAISQQQGDGSQPHPPKPNQKVVAPTQKSGIAFFSAFGGFVPGKTTIDQYFQNMYNGARSHLKKETWSRSEVGLSGSFDVHKFTYPNRFLPGSFLLSAVFDRSKLVGLSMEHHCVNMSVCENNCTIYQNYMGNLASESLGINLSLVESRYFPDQWGREGVDTRRAASSSLYKLKEIVTILKGPDRFDYCDYILLIGYA